MSTLRTLRPVVGLALHDPEKSLTDVAQRSDQWLVIRTFGSPAMRMAVAAISADVLQVQTSSRAGSEPNAIVTWSGTGLETTWVFQTRPVASRVE